MPEQSPARPYRIGDRDACLRIFDSNVPEYFDLSEREEFATFLDALPGPYHVLEAPGEGVVACGGHALRPGEPIADLCWGMVRSDLHGRGLGRALTEARMAAAGRSASVRTIALNTSQRTTGFYERFGFEIIEVVRDGYRPGLDRCEMRMALSGTRPAGGR